MNTTKYYGLVNRKCVIATLEAKALITGFRWVRPNKIPKGFREHHSKKGDFLYYSLTEPVTIRDVDGREKDTIRTCYLEKDRKTPHKQSAFGVWCNGRAGAYHGRKSRNWQQECLTLKEIIAVLNTGSAFAPGLFNPPAGESYRSGAYCEERQIILFDADEWTDQCPAPADLNALVEQYPDLATDFYWVGESISSRSSLKPELRCRLMLVLPKPIRKGQSDLWQTVVKAITDKYPFIAKGVGIDKVRASFGNARPECENTVLGGRVSLNTFSDWKHIASEKQAKAEVLRLETERIKKERQERRDKDNKVKTELKRCGHSVVENVDPIWAFCEVDPVSLLTELGLATHLSDNAWNWHASSPGRSFELSDGVIKPFSNTMQSKSPESDGTKPVNAHRYILYYLHKLDITHDSDKREVRCILADQGYGTHPDDYKQSKRQEKVKAVRAGLISPLELRSAAKPLPVEKERPRRVLQTLEQNATVIREAFEQDVRVVGLRAGTGEGKTEQAISFAVSGGSVAMSLNTTPLAEQVYSRFQRAETHAFLWRSRWWGYGNSECEKKQINLIPIRQRIRAFERGDLLCIKPHLCKNAQDQGIPAPVAVCATCEVQSKCRSDGYLSQTPIAQSAQVLCIAQPKLFLDPLHSGFFRELSRGQPKDRVCVIDEAKAHELFIECSLSKAVLQQWTHDWEGESLGDFAKHVLTMLEVDRCSPYGVAEYVAGKSDKEIQVLSKQCSQYRVSYERTGRGATDPKTGKTLAYHSVRFPNGAEAYVAYDFEAYDRLLELDMPALQPQEVFDNGYMVLTPAQAFSLGVYGLADLDALTALPRLYDQSNWTPFQQLKAFIERYPREVDAPIWYDDAVLQWVIPPVVHNCVTRLVCMSATLQREGFERACYSVPTTFIETSPTHWVNGASAYQVRTGRYPRASLLDYDTHWNVVGLSKSGARFLDLIQNEVAPHKSIQHILITVNAIVDLYGTELTEKHKNLSVLSFHKMEGLDFTKSGVVFWVLGSPDVSDAIIDQRAKIQYGNDSKPLQREWNPKTKRYELARIKESREYVDPRSQLCWEAEVAARLQQAVGRARLNRLANTVVVFSNVFIPDFTDQAVGFVPEDLEVADGLDNLTAVAETREQAEKNALKKQEKTARQRKKEARDLKAKRIQTALELYDAGVSPTEISERVGASRRSIFNWVKKRGF